MKRCIVLPSGRRVTLGVYVAAWRKLRTIPGEAMVRGFGDFPMSAADVLKEIRGGVADRINRHLPHYGQGRKWSSDWYWTTWRASRELNDPLRPVIRWLPRWLAGRFRHRLFED